MRMILKSDVQSEKESFIVTCIFKYKRLILLDFCKKIFSLGKNMAKIAINLK